MALSAAERKFGFGGNSRIISRKAFNFFSSGVYKFYGVCYNNVTLTAEEDGFVGVFRKARIYFRAVSPFRAVCFSAQTAAAFRSANSRLAGRVVCIFRRAEILRLNAWTEILKYVAVYHFYIYAEKRWSTINIGDLSSSIFFLFRFSGFLKSTR